MEARPPNSLRHGTLGDMLLLMTLLDGEDSAKQAVARGFAKGVSAPAVLFGNNTARGVRMLEVKRTKTGRVQLPASVELSDWDRIGADVREALRRHEQTRAQPSR